MKKMLSIVLVIVLTSAAFAAVQLTITVPDAYTALVLAAMNELAGANMMLEARKSSSEPENDFDGRWDFTIAPKDPNETNKHFAERFTRELLRASVRVVKSHEENDRYRNEIRTVSPPDVNVPDGVIE